MTGPARPDEDANNGEVVAVLCLSERTLRPFFYDQKHTMRFISKDYISLPNQEYTLFECLGGLGELRFFLERWWSSLVIHVELCATASCRVATEEFVLNNWCGDGQEHLKP